MREKVLEHILPPQLTGLRWRPMSLMERSSKRAFGPPRRISSLSSAEAETGFNHHRQETRQKTNTRPRPKVGLSLARGGWCSTMVGAPALFLLLQLVVLRVLRLWLRTPEGAFLVDRGEVRLYTTWLLLAGAIFEDQDPFHSC